MSDCVFCVIAADPSSAVLIYEDAEIYAALDIAPIQKGHSLIVTKQHVETFELLSGALASKVMTAGWEPPGVEISWNDGRAWHAR